MNTARTSFWVVVVLFIAAMSVHSADAAVVVNMLSPLSGDSLKGTVTLSAEVSSPVVRLQFYIAQNSNHAVYTYNAVQHGATWDYTLDSTRLGDDSYQLYAAAVDGSNFTYLSQFVNITVNNVGSGNPDDPDTNLNTNQPVDNPPTNGNQNTNGNGNVNTNTPTNSNSNSNTSNSNGNTNTPLNINGGNVNNNVNTNTPNAGNGSVNTPGGNEGNSNTGTPSGPDADNDQLPDTQETKKGTDPGNPDTDGDGYTDGYEVNHDRDPNLAEQPASRTATIPEAYRKAMTSIDVDRDGLDDGIEALIGSNLVSPDTDYDGRLDGFEFYSGTNPNVAEPDEVKQQIKIIQEEEQKSFPWLAIGIPVVIVLVFVAIGYSNAQRS